MTQRIQDTVPCGSKPLIRRFCPWIPKLPDPLLAAKFKRDERPGTDNPPPELMFLLM